MAKDREIQVSLSPSNQPCDKEKPYFWWIKEWDDDLEVWSASGLCGWAKTPIEAFNIGFKTNEEDIDK